MAGCKIDSEASVQFNTLRSHWKKKGYPSVDKDLENAYKELSKDLLACHCKPAGRTSAILKQIAPDRDAALHKYRCKDTANSEGAQGGWRFYAILDRPTATLYPIIVYPHKQWSDATEELIRDCVKELMSVLKQRRAWTERQSIAQTEPLPVRLNSRGKQL